MLFQISRRINENIMADLTWQELLDRITKLAKMDRVLPSFQNSENDLQRVSFCLQRRLVTENLDVWLDARIKKGTGGKKCGVKASDLRLKGNKQFVKGRYLEALRYYNSALQFCPSSVSNSDSQRCLPLIYGNRSAVYFHLKNYDACLLDINAAVDSGYPKEKVVKLYKRKLDALKKTGRTDIAEVFLKSVYEEFPDFEYPNLFSHSDDPPGSDFTSGKDSSNVYLLFKGPHECIQQASSCLHLCFTESKGRYITAKCDIPSGSVIIREDPYAAILLPNWYLSNCSHCFDSLLHPVPCLLCSDVMYCSEECRQTSWTKYHHFECGLLGLLGCLGVAHLALRIILVTDKLLLVRYAVDHQITSYANSLEERYICDYESVFNLVTNADKMPCEDLFQYTLTAILLGTVLERHHYFHSSSRDASFNDTVSENVLITSLIARHIQQLVGNAHAITCLKDVEHCMSQVVDQEQHRLATAIYPTTSLLNHSCSPCIVNTFQKDKLVVRITKDIRAGEEIYNCYGPDYRKMKYKERQDILSSQYFFTCDCEHCEKGSSEEKLFDSFVCRSCVLPVSDAEAACSNCRATIDWKLLVSEKNVAERLFVDGLRLLEGYSSQDSIRNAKSKFQKCLEKRKLLFVSTHQKIVEAKDVIAKCEVMLCNCRTAIDLLEECITVAVQRFGPSSTEVMYEQLKLSDVYVEYVQKQTGSEDLKERFEQLHKGVNVIKRAKELLLLNNGGDEEELRSLELKENLFKSFLSF